jgi:hypothetical protein
MPRRAVRPHFPFLSHYLTNSFLSFRRRKNFKTTELQIMQLSDADFDKDGNRKTGTPYSFPSSASQD